jgi:hypothetical protein
MRVRVSLLCVPLHQNLRQLFGNKLWRIIIPEPSKQLIKNPFGVKDMGLADLEESLQQRPHYHGVRNQN